MFSVCLYWLSNKGKKAPKMSKKKHCKNFADFHICECIYPLMFDGLLDATSEYIRLIKHTDITEELRLNHSQKSIYISARQ